MYMTERVFYERLEETINSRHREGWRLVGYTELSRSSQTFLVTYESLAEPAKLTSEQAGAIHLAVMEIAVAEGLDLPVTARMANSVLLRLKRRGMITA